MTTLVHVPCPLSRGEETANQITHAIGMALAIVGTVVLLRQTAAGQGDVLQFVGITVYGVTLVALYAASTLSHSFEAPRWRHFFRTVDQVCIFLLIAGTFTPMALTYLREGWWWLLFAAMWTAAFAGILAKIFLTRLNNVTMSAYVLMGWMPTVAVKQIMECVPGPVLAWMAIGGIMYTLGTWFLVRDERVPFFHAVWHVFVIAGSACHYYAVLRYVAPWES